MTSCELRESVRHRAGDRCGYCRLPGWALEPVGVPYSDLLRDLAQAPQLARFQLGRQRFRALFLPVSMDRSTRTAPTPR